MRAITSRSQSLLFVCVAARESRRVRSRVRNHSQRCQHRMQSRDDEDVDVGLTCAGALDVDALASAFNSDCFAGITSHAQVDANRERFGANTTPAAKTYTAYDFVARALDDVTLRALIVSGALSLILEGSFGAGDRTSVSWLNGAAILLAVAVVVGVETWNNLSKQRSFAALNARSDAESVVSVTRFGSPRLLPRAEVVVGDVLNLDAGDVACVDARVIDSSAFMCDMSHITGESEECPASRDDVVYAGSRVTSGKGTALVIAVGTNSTQGKILQLTREGGGVGDGDAVNVETPLQARLARLAVSIGRVGIGAAALVGTILATSLTWEYYVTTGDFIPPIESAVEYLDVVVTAITIAVVSVPEVRLMRERLERFLWLID